MRERTADGRLAAIAAPATIAVYDYADGPRCLVSLSQVLAADVLRWTRKGIRVQPRFGEGGGDLLRLRPGMDGGRPLLRHGARWAVTIFLKRAGQRDLGYIPTAHRALAVGWELDLHASRIGHDLLVELPDCWRPRS